MGGGGTTYIYIYIYIYLHMHTCTHILESSFCLAQGLCGTSIEPNRGHDDYIPRSLALLRKGGRFMEIGKRGIWSHEQLLGWFCKCTPQAPKHSLFRVQCLSCLLSSGCSKPVTLLNSVGRVRGQKSAQISTLCADASCQIMS